MFDLTESGKITLSMLGELVTYSKRDEILMTSEQDKAYRKLLHDDDKDNEVVFYRFNKILIK